MSTTNETSKPAPTCSLVACTHKRKYRTLERVQLAQERMQAKEPGKIVNAFYCAIHRAYHLGTTPRGGTSNARRSNPAVPA